MDETAARGAQRPVQAALTRTGAQAAGVVALPLAASPEAAREARAALRELLLGTVFAPRLDEAALALTELVTNAVLHGREPLGVRLRVDAEVLRVEVLDASPLGPSFSMLGPTAVTGRGLLLVAASSERWGIEPADGGKVVWFELDAVPEAPGEVDVDALLAAWAGDLADPAEEVVKVVLTELPVALSVRAEAHVEALLRELSLLRAGDTPVDDVVARTAERVLQAAAPVEAMRAEMRRQLTVAVAEGRERVDVVLSVTRVDADAVRAFAAAVDDADRVSRSGVLLTEPASRELSEARTRALRRIVAQLSD